MSRSLYALFLLLGPLVLAGSSRALPEMDFSSCGYAQSAVPIPEVAARILVRPAVGDDGGRIQAALDHVASLAPDASGFRGAVLLAPGQFEVSGQLRLRASGVVLRGSGVAATTILATGLDRRALLRIVGKGDLQIDLQNRWRVIDESVSVGTKTLKVNDVSGLKMGDAILVTRPSTQDWIKALGMDRFGIAWKPGTRDVRWERRIVGVDRAAKTITIDAPLTTALEAGFGGGRVEKFAWPGRIENVGVENLELVSGVPTANALDEEHAWHGITMENVKNAWVRQITFRRFAGGAVALWESAKNVTVKDCISREPISEVGGYRRHTFFTMGQQSLFLRCWSEDGRHDFAVGHCAAGPNAFVFCHAQRALAASGPLESWASGVLYDNVTIDGAALELVNRWSADQGAGWCAANCAIWQSSAAEIRCFQPPTAQNQAIGVWASCIGDGIFEALDEFVKPRSLFQAQLAARLGDKGAVSHLGPIGRDTVGATNPTHVQAERFVAGSNHPAVGLREIIDKAGEREPIASVPGDLPTSDEVAIAFPASRTPARELTVKEGQLWIGDRPLAGERFTPIWWRGNIRPGEAPGFGPAITRFVPGREGKGFTDDLVEVADELQASGVAIVEHHHGLWYDRRRDDHLRVRRADGEVVPPFYEQPFARSGRGKAWDGLSKYDLAKYNPWYWNRLREFADQCDRKGLVLLQQHYFQHNLLEAGAHWADFPWRAANNINETGFPEPPPYAGDKRIFQAHLFYEVAHFARRQLHRNYIRQCLDNTAENSNVIHSLGAEFTGPLKFMQFWIDTMIEWEGETKRDALVCLSCTKDVQDAILADPVRAQAISVIDIRYWWDASDGRLYAPEGGKNLSPRQLARQLKPQRPSTESKRRAVREYRERFPDKAVLFDGEPHP